MRHAARNQKSGIRDSAFTLVELLLVIVIIGILAGSITVSLVGRAEQARITRARADITGSLAIALDLFEQDIGRYPTPEEGLEVLASDANVPNWNGPYLKSGVKPDPWKTPYRYDVDPENPNHYRLSSAGPDGKHDTEDDIVDGES
ncbi:MAG: type II secretion system protein GspG [Phycisphaeraceae bacterium]|nr:type II secretion system protein GspG [Phycisphaeraceae bacterium]